MAKVFIEESTLTKIGNAIRGKTGKTDLIDPAVMDVEISSITVGSGGGGDEVPSIELTGDCSYACSGAIASTFMGVFPNKVTTKDITKGAYMFYGSSALDRIPFTLNFKVTSVDCSYMFRDCKKLTYIPDINFNSSNSSNSSIYVTTLTSLFQNCESLVNPPQILNCTPGSMADLFADCRSLEQIPDDYFSTFDASYINSSIASYMCRVFSSCYKLRRIPSSFFPLCSGSIVNYPSYTCYSGLATNCYSLDEIVDLPVLSKTYTSSCFSGMVNSCCRLKRLTFKTNEDGTPQTANWKSQTLDLSGAVGYTANTSTILTKTGFTTETQVTDDATYQALKDNPDYWTALIAYSCYNHDSAVETINSLPDTSAYLATASGTNTIKFRGAAGSATDGGAINTLTEEEIAVATAKGWTVTFV